MENWFFKTALKNVLFEKNFFGGMGKCKKCLARNFFFWDEPGECAR